MFKQTGENDSLAQDWQTLSINLIHSKKSHKKTLIVNGNILISKVKLVSFGRGQPYALPVSGTIKISLSQVADHDFELTVSGVSFTNLLKQ